MIIDTHTHLEPQHYAKIRELLKQNDIRLLVNALNVNEYQKLQDAFTHEIQTKQIQLSFGIHPWDADTQKISHHNNPLNKFTPELTKIFHEIPVIGEIGLDNYWGKAPLETQTNIFIAQLDIAQKLHKPVILHTKGQEKQIAEIIAKYTMPKLIHWYDDTEFIDAYLAQNCYFTINPDYLKNNKIREMVKRVPLEKLLVESDGITGLEWALKEKISPARYLELLQGTYVFIAKNKGISTPQCIETIRNNYKNFIKD